MYYICITELKSPVLEPMAKTVAITVEAGEAGRRTGSVDVGFTLKKLGC